MTNNTTATAPLTVTYTLAYTPKGAPTFFRLGQIIPAGTMLLMDDETFVTTQEDYLVKGKTKVAIKVEEKLATGLIKKNNKEAFVAAAHGR
jgi:hypothetical protein